MKLDRYTPIIVLPFALLVSILVIGFKSPKQAKEPTPSPATVAYLDAGYVVDAGTWITWEPASAFTISIPEPVTYRFMYTPKLRATFKSVDGGWLIEGCSSEGVECRP